MVFAVQSISAAGGKSKSFLRGSRRGRRRLRSRAECAILILACGRRTALEQTPIEQNHKQPKTKRQVLLRVIGAVVFVAANALVLFFTARSDFGRDRPPLPQSPFAGKNLLYLLCAIGCLLLAITAESVKFLCMMRRLKERVSVRQAFETTVLGKYYDYITPSGAGGQPFQIWNFHAHGYSSGASSAMPLASFVTLQFGFVLIAITVFLFNNGAVEAVGIKIAAYIGLIFYSLVPILIVLSAISPKTTSRIIGFFVRIGAKLRLIRDPQRASERAENALRRYSDSLKFIARSKSLLITLFLLSIVYQLAICSIPYFVVRMFGGDLGFIRSLCMCVFVYFSVTIVPTPGNAGAAEGSFYILFNRLDTSGLFWAMLIWRFLTFYVFLLLGLAIYVVRILERAYRRRKRKAEGS